MKTTPVYRLPVWFPLYLLAVVSIVLLFVGCAGPGAGAAEQVRTFMDAAMADGVLDPTETERLISLLDMLVERESQSIQLDEMLLGLAGTAASTFLGVNIFRNKTRKTDPNVANRLAKQEAPRA